MPALIILLKIILYIVLFLLGLVLIFLIIPFTYSGKALIHEGYKLRLDFGWAWNFIKISAEAEDQYANVTLRILNKFVIKPKAFRSKIEKKQEQAEEKKLEEKVGRGSSLKDFINKEFISEVLEYIKKILNTVKPKYIHLYGKYGFEDPAVTGMVSGLEGIVKAMLPEARLQLEPVFDKEVFDLDFRIKGKMIAGTVAYHTIRTALKKPIRQVIFKKKK